MKKLFLFLLLASACLGQSYTSVTATIADANGTPYASGTFNARLTVSPGTRTTLLNGNVLVNPGAAAIPYDVINGISGQLDNSGTMNVQLMGNANILPAGTQWSFTICAADTVTCFISAQTITGTTQNLSTALSSASTIYYDVRGNAIKAGPGGVTFNDSTRQSTAGGGGGGGGGLADPGSNGILKRTALNITAVTGSTDVVALFSGVCSSTTYLAGDGTCSTPSGSGNLADPGANGIIKRTALNTTAASASADVIGLFSGTCSPTTYLAGDGTCSTPSGSGNLADPGSNGIIKRTALNTTAASGNSDVISLWTGSCSSTTYLRGDGSCATPSGSGQVADPGGNGIMKRTALNTTAVAARADVTGLWTGTCNASSYLRGDGACATPSGTLSGRVKFMSSFGTPQLALTGMSAGDTMYVDGTFTLCSGTLSASNVKLTGSGFQSGALTCNIANQPVLTVSGNGVEVSNLNINHSVSPTSGGDGLIISGGTTSNRVLGNLIQSNWNNLNVGQTSFGIVQGNYLQRANNDCMVFTSDGVTPVMQWDVQTNLAQQCLGWGYNFTLGASVNSLQITCPRFIADTAYGNKLGGYNISASAATTSGISDCFFSGMSFASFNNGDGIRIDAGPNGGRNIIIAGGFSELSGQYGLTAGFANATQTPTNVGHGLDITSSCDGTSPPQVSTMEFWENSYSGAISACAGTQFNNIDAFKNGLASSANSYERAAVAIRASNISVLGGHFRDSGSHQINGVDISNSADSIMVMANCDAGVANCLKQTTTPTNLTAIFPSSITTNGTTGSGKVRSTWLLGDQGTAQTSGNIALSGWGSGAAVSAVTGYSQRTQFTITAGTSPSASPTIIVTYPDAAPIAPVCYAVASGGTGAISTLSTGTPSTTTSGTLTWVGTPTNTQTYKVVVDCRL